MTALTPDRINRLIARREKLTRRRDEHINVPAVNEIDAQLATIPAGQDNRVDLLLGRLCAKLPPRADYAVEVNAALERAASEAGAQAEWLTPAQVARLEALTA